jgi:uncharacterized protein
MIELERGTIMGKEMIAMLLAGGQGSRLYALTQKLAKPAVPFGGKEKKETLSMLLAALKNKQIDKRADLTEEEEIQVIMKEIKQTKETLEMTPADRTDIIEECNRRLTVLEAYAPKMMGEDEIKAIIEGVLSELGIENPTGKDKGNIMKHLMPKVKGKADGKLVNDLVSTYFK